MIYVVGSVVQDKLVLVVVLQNQEIKALELWVDIKSELD